MMKDSAMVEDYLPFFDASVTFNLRDYTGRRWKQLSDVDKEVWIDDIFRFYRNNHGFPYPIMTPEKIRSQLHLLGKLPTDSLVHGEDIRWNGFGLVLCSHYFPHLWKVACRDIGSTNTYRRTAWEAFHIDDALRDSIRLGLTMGKNGGVMPNDLQDSFSLGCGKWWVAVPSRFKPSVAKFIWDTYAPQDGVVYDYAAGWGGRLLGAVSSKKNLTYVAVDPSEDTWKCLVALGKDAGSYYKSKPVRIEKVGSEDFCPQDLVGKVDVAFSSPPYFNLEAYSNDAGQSHIRYSDLDVWLDRYMKGTLLNCRDLLKTGGYLAINIKDTSPYSFVDQILAYIHSLGFKDVKVWQMEMKQRRGHGFANDVHVNHEPIYVFQKP